MFEDRKLQRKLSSLLGVHRTEFNVMVGMCVANEQ